MIIWMWSFKTVMRYYTSVEEIFASFPCKLVWSGPKFNWHLVFGTWNCAILILLLIR
ncbi:hypothetical protein BDR03DRAFT_960754 [Suillus americanus]|nr:hypothetical protein BDR03DRAFT_960754 [Suillus americanus]